MKRVVGHLVMARNRQRKAALMGHLPQVIHGFFWAQEGVEAGRKAHGFTVCHSSPPRWGFGAFPAACPGLLVMPGVAVPGRGRSVRPGAATLLPPRGLRAAGRRTREVCCGGLIVLRTVPIFAGHHIPRRQSHDSRMMTRLG